MIKNIIFDFDGVLVDSEVIVAKSLCRYLANIGIRFEEKEFFQFAGTKTIDLIADLSSRFDIKDKQKFFTDVKSLANNLYINELKAIPGVENFLINTNHKRLIGSNNLKNRILEALKKVHLIKYFAENSIFAFDLVQKAKPLPDIYLSALKFSGISVAETVIIEDTVIGVQAGVAAGVRVIGLTAGGHWHKDRSDKDLYDAGAYEVVKDYKEMLILLNNL